MDEFTDEGFLISVDGRILVQMNTFSTFRIQQSGIKCAVLFRPLEPGTFL